MNTFISCKWRNMVTFLFVFFFNAVIAIQQQYPFIVPDEIGVAANTAFFTGENWSTYITKTPYYGFGQAVLYIPIFLFTSNPILRSICMGIVNSLLISSVFVISYTIFYRYLGLKQENAYIYSVLASIFPSYTVYSKWMWNETLMGVLPWLILMIILELNQNEKLKFSRSCILAFFCVYSYAVHGRALAIILTVFMLIIGLHFISKKQIVCLPVFIGALLMSYLLYHVIYCWLISDLWLSTNEKNIGNTLGSSLQQVLNLFTIEGLRSVIPNVLGGIYASVCSTFGLIFIFFHKFFTCLKIFILKIHSVDCLSVDKQNWALSFSYISILFIFAFAISIVALNGRVGDYLIYTRYYANTLGMIAVFSVIIMAERKFPKQYLVIISFEIAVGLLCGMLISPFCGFSRPYVFANLYPFIGVGIVGYELLYLTSIIAVVAYGLIALYYYGEKKWIIITISTICVFSYAYCSWNVILKSYEDAKRQVGPIYEIFQSYATLSDHFSQVVVFLSGGASGRFQFALPEYHVNECSPANIGQFTLPDNVLIIAERSLMLNYFFPDCYRINDEKIGIGPMTVWVHGDEIKYFMERSFDVVFSKSNEEITLPSFLTQVGKKTNNNIISSGKEGYLLYGPYVTLPSGKYEIIMKGKLNRRNNKKAGFFDLVSQQGKKVLIPKKDIDSFIDNSIFEMHESFTLPEMMHNIEFRLYVTEGTVLELTNIVIKKVEKEN